MNEGFVLIPRSLLNDAVFHKKEKYSRVDAYIYLVKEARWQHNPVKIKGLTCGKNQVVCSFGELMSQWNLNNKNEVKRYLDFLEKGGWIKTKRSLDATLITIVLEPKCNGNVTQNVTDSVTGNTSENQGVVGGLVTQHVTTNVTEMLSKRNASCAQVITESDLFNNSYNKEEEEIKTPYNPPIGDETKYVSLEEFNKLKEAFTSLSDENKKLREDIELSQKKSRSTFTPPTEEEVAEYIREKGYHFEASAFIAFYESKGWMVGKNKMKDWKASCSGWESRNKQTKKSYDIYDINHSADNRDPHKYDRTMELWGIK